LSEIEAKAVLAAYGIPSVPTRRASDADSAAAIAAEFTVPVALKILSPDISHKTDVGGVVLDLETPNSVRAAAIEMMLRVARLRPQARIEGFTVQPMARRPHATELIVGFASDPVFGPVVLFGHGGRAVEVVRDRAVALPPLNHSLARALVAETRVARLLAGFRDQPPADQNAIGDTLLKLAAIAIAHPEIAELDINPLWADADGVLALDARARLTEPGVAPTRPAIGPYPEDLAETLTLSSGGSVFVRPIRPEDEQSHAELFAALSPDDVRARFFGAVAHLSHEQLARYTQIDYDREIAFVAFADRHSARILGVARAVADPDNERAEFAVVVRSDCKRRGLGRALLAKIVRYAQARGVGVLSGVTRPDNKAMIGLARSLGFSTLAAPEGTVLELALRPRSPQA
jgi:acetyltransferase